MSTSKRFLIEESRYENQRLQHLIILVALIALATADHVPAHLFCQTLRVNLLNPVQHKMLVRFNNIQQHQTLLLPQQFFPSCVLDGSITLERKGLLTFEGGGWIIYSAGKV
uniref:Uncharacterized protein n=1 Tax=Salix viminalis TaxID=40686 RepID=A0A6N2M261_SALVM